MVMRDHETGQHQAAGSIQHVVVGFASRCHDSVVDGDVTFAAGGRGAMKCGATSNQKSHGRQR